MDTESDIQCFIYFFFFSSFFFYIYTRIHCNNNYARVLSIGHTDTEICFQSITIFVVCIVYPCIFYIIDLYDTYMCVHDAACVCTSYKIFYLPKQNYLHVSIVISFIFFFTLVLSFYLFLFVFYLPFFFYYYNYFLFF